MLTLQEITKVVSDAVNGAINHYFYNMVAGPDKADEAQFIAEFMQQTQLWLFFTEEAMEELHKTIYKSDIQINLVYSLSVLFHQRVTISEEDYARFVKHLTWSVDAKFAEEDPLSIMASQYRERIPNAENIEVFLRSNRPWVFLCCMASYLETSNLVAALAGVKE